AFVTKPAWQHDGGCNQRTVGDVAADADPNTGGGVRYNNNWYIFGGTSVASPIVSAVYALAGGSVTYGSDPYHSNSLFDVSSGSNGSCAGSYLCTGTVGYDGPTGLGTPNGVAAFAAATSAGHLVFATAAQPLTAGSPSTALSLSLVDAANNP